jgi:hypothetical protein
VNVTTWCFRGLAGIPAGGVVRHRGALPRCHWSLGAYGLIVSAPAWRWCGSPRWRRTHRLLDHEHRAPCLAADHAQSVRASGGLTPSSCGSAIHLGRLVCGARPGCPASARFRRGERAARVRDPESAGDRSVAVARRRLAPLSGFGGRGTGAPATGSSREFDPRRDDSQLASLLVGCLRAKCRLLIPYATCVAGVTST